MLTLNDPQHGDEPEDCVKGIIGCESRPDGLARFFRKTQLLIFHRHANVGAFGVIGGSFESASSAQSASRYNFSVRRNSAIDRAKQRERVERARRMTAETRLLASVNISRLTAEFQNAGDRYRQESLQKTRS